jgi:hypothetical protein
MSKKLIAIAAAAALALTGLVATPASAASFTVDIDSTANVAAHSASTAALEIQSAMTTRTLDYHSSSSTTRNVMRFIVNTAAATTVTVSADGGVKLTDVLEDAAGAALVLGAGSANLSKATATGSLSYTFYAYTNSTTAGKVTIETATTKATYWIKAKAGQAYNLTNVKFPASVVQGQSAADSTAVISYNLTDAFGNSITTGAQNVVLTALGATAATSHTYSTVRKVWETTVFSATASSVAMNLLLNTTDRSAAGFPKPVINAFSSVTGADLATQVTTLTAQVTALQATVAALTADYNKLANRFNKLQAAKKAPKKKVALK